MKWLLYLLIAAPVFQVLCTRLNPQERCAKEVRVDYAEAKKMFESNDRPPNDKAESFYGCVWKSRNILDENNNFDESNFINYVMALVENYRGIKTTDVQKREAILFIRLSIQEVGKKEPLKTPLGVKQALDGSIFSILFTMPRVKARRDFYMTLP